MNMKQQSLPPLDYVFEGQEILGREIDVFPRALPLTYFIRNGFPALLVRVFLYDEVLTQIFSKAFHINRRNQKQEFK